MTEQLEQGTQEWLDARFGKITGSRIGAILGLNPYSKREDVMREMVREYFGAEREFTGNDATDYGTEHEPVAIQDYELKTGNDVKSVGFIEDQTYSWLGVSPDGLIGEDGGVEVKCPYSQKLFSIHDKPYYYAQVCLCLAVTCRKWWDFVVWTPDEMTIERVSQAEADAFMYTNFDRLIGFFSEYEEIIGDEDKAAEYLAPLELDLSDDHEFDQAVQSYLAAKDLAVKAKKAETEAKTILENIAKRHNVKRIRGNGVTISKATRQGSVKYSDIPELKGVDLEQYRGEPTTYYVIK